MLRDIPSTTPNRRTMLKLLAATPWLGAATGAARSHDAPGFDPFVVYYAHRDHPALPRYRLAALDSEVDDAALRHRDSMTLLGYLTVGEADSFRAYFAEVEREGILGDANPLWPESRFVDLRDTRWRDRLVDDLAPAILARGFHGLILDTLDNAAVMERAEPRRYGGMVEAAADIVHALRRSAPDALIMINRGYAVLPHVVGEFDMLLAESMIGGFEADRTYRRVPPEEYAWQRREVRRAWRRDKRLKLFGLDYWDPADREGVARIYAMHRAEGIVPYVATPDLFTIVEEP